MNEPWCSAYLGYASGEHAPGKQVGARRPPGGPPPVARARLVGRADARGRRRRGRRRAQPDTRAARDRGRCLAADGVDALRNRVWLGPLVDGEYDAGTLARRARPGGPRSWFGPATSTWSVGSADWLGVNYYTPARVQR